MRHGGRVKCPLPVPTDSQDGALDKNIFYRFSTKNTVYEKTKV